MRKDMPKYDDTGVFTAEVKEEWDNFLSTFSDCYGKVPDEEPTWILNEIAALIAERPSSPAQPQPAMPQKVQKKVSALAQCREV